MTVNIFVQLLIPKAEEKIRSIKLTQNYQSLDTSGQR